VTFSQLVSCSTRFSQEDRLLVIIQSLIDFLYWELAQKRAWCWLVHVHLGQSRLLVPIPSYFHSQLKPSFWVTLAVQFSGIREWKFIKYRWVCLKIGYTQFQWTMIRFPINMAINWITLW
jgi:hypothetical protein